MTVHHSPANPLHFLARQRNLAGYLARAKLLRRLTPPPKRLRERLTRGVLFWQAPRGSWRFSVGWTAYRLQELAALDYKGDFEPAQRAVNWIWQFQGEHGNFAERPIVPTQYPSPAGEDFNTEPASLAFTAYILQGLLPFVDTDDERFQRAVGWLLETHDGRHHCCVHCAMHTLTLLSQLAETRHHRVVDSILHWLARQRRKLGNWFWSPTYNFITLYGLSHLDSLNAAALVRGALPWLMQTQNPDGSWGDFWRAEKTLLVTQALVRFGLLEEFLRRVCGV